MEVEEDEELGELCAEILENWNSPIYSDAHSLHQNPFSLHQPLNTTLYDVQRVNKKQGTTFFHANMQTKASMSKQKCNDPIREFESRHEDNIILKASKANNYKGYKYEEANDKRNSIRSMDRSIVPVLVADTFYDKLLGQAVDGIDIASLNNIKWGNACKNEGGPGNASENNSRRTEKLNSAQVSSMFMCNFSMVNKMPKSSPISCGYRHMPVTGTAAPIGIRSTYQRGYVAKSSWILPSYKTIFDINIDDFGEKMWRSPGVDLSDFFNYGLDEKQWKDYCKLMAHIRVRRFRGSKITANEGRQSLKKALRDSSYEDESRRQLIRKYGVSSDDGCVILHSKSRSTPNINYRMINGDMIVPSPMDNYSAEDGEWIEEPIRKYYNTHLTKLSRGRNTQHSITHSEVELTDFNEMPKQRSSGNQGEFSLSHVGQRSQKKIRLCNENQTSHHKVGLNLVESLYSPMVESEREKREYDASPGLQKESFNRTFPTNGNSSAITMKVEEDPEKLKRRKERFSCPLQF